VVKKITAALLGAAVVLTLWFVSPWSCRARPVAIYIGGDVVEVSTRSRIVGDILAEAGITLDPQRERAIPSVEAELDLPLIFIDRAAEVVIRADGREWQAVTWARTVAELLQEQGLSVEGDLVDPPLLQSIKSGHEITVIRVERELLVREESIPAQTAVKKDNSLPLGKEVVHKKARDGVKRVTYEIVYHDGEEVSRQAVAEEVLVPPVDGVILRGTRAAASRGVLSVQEGIASYYGAQFHGRRTASGVPFDMNAMTAAHLTLEFGTMVRVTYLKTGKSVVVEINDRGPHVPGRIIDLSAAAAKAIGLYADGIGKVKVEVLE